MAWISGDTYLNQLVSKRNNGLIKILVGPKGCGKSTILDPFFRDYLIQSGVKADHSIKMELDRDENKIYLHEPEKLNTYLRSFIKDGSMYCFLLDEIQLVDDFESLLNGFLYDRNIDVYVTGSNSKFLSTEIIREFRGRDDFTNVSPLTFQEDYEYVQGSKSQASRIIFYLEECHRFLP